MAVEEIGSESKERRYREEFEKERRERRQLQQQFEEMQAENRRQRKQADEVERLDLIREGLEARGVAKTKLALRLMKDDVSRDGEGQLCGSYEGSRMALGAYPDRFLADNPEFLPPRITGGSGVSGRGVRELGASGVDLESIQPGMSREETRAAWKEVARLMGG
jgi:hypothetical protein